jgi:tetratricopeptide (TPR) repeat protein
LGDEHPHTLWFIGNLGELYTNQGRYNEAEPLLVKALEMRRRVLGEEHPETLDFMNSLGDLYSRQGRYNEAEPLLVKALEIRRRILGEEHPDTLSSMHSLGWLYYRWGRYNEAEPLFIKALEGRQRVLGEENPDTLESMNQLARMRATSPVTDLRNGAKAIEYATKTCELTKWKNASYVDTLAAAYAEAGDFDSAVKWQKEAINLLTKEEAAKWQAEFEERLKLYQSGKPYRESP